MNETYEDDEMKERTRRAECRSWKLERRVAPIAIHEGRITDHVCGIRSAFGNSGEAVWLQQGDGSSIDGEHPLIAKDAQQADGGFNRHPGHLGHFFPFERESHPDMIVMFFTKSIAEFQQQAG